jgi:hypothetical protein
MQKAPIPLVIMCPPVRSRFLVRPQFLTRVLWDLRRGRHVRQRPGISFVNRTTRRGQFSHMCAH